MEPRRNKGRKKLGAYYNENDAYAAQWLRNLIEAGHIASGDVDERSIVDVRADDLKGFKQCHFFAGIGGWSIALRLAGWPDDRPVWTGSCPCQPFSAAGAGKAADDGRHLWPAWLPLIQECRPATVFGEQVEAAVGWGWLDAVFSDLEAEGYAIGASVLPACGVGAPHIRQRLWFVADNNAAGRSELRSAQLLDGERTTQRHDLDGRGAASELADANGGDASAEGLQRGGQHGQRAEDGRAGELADSDSTRRRPWRPSETSGGRDAPRIEFAGLRTFGGLADSKYDGGRADQPQREAQGRTLDGRPDPWGCEWLRCTDGKARPVEPGSFPLAHGVQRRASKLRAYGNAIIPPLAAEFIKATMKR